MNRRDFMRRMFGVTVTLAVPQLWTPLFNGLPYRPHPSQIAFFSSPGRVVFCSNPYFEPINPRRLGVITNIQGD